MTKDRTTEAPTSLTPVMTLHEVCSYLRISQRTAFRWMKRGSLPAFKVGGIWRFDREQIQPLALPK